MILCNAVHIIVVITLKFDLILFHHYVHFYRWIGKGKVRKVEARGLEKEEKLWSECSYVLVSVFIWQY